MTEHVFLIGAQRSGTTSLYHLLEAHPQIEMARPMRPEPKFFLRQDIESLQPEDYYKAHFQAASTAALRGEKSTSYIEFESAARRIANWFPGAKILLIVREPIARAISNYYFTKNHGLEPLLLEDALRQEEQRRDNYDRSKISASPYAYRKRGHYMEYIDVYRRYFPDEAIKVLIYEEFIGKLEPVKALYGWLGVDTDFSPDDLTKQHNPSERAGESYLSHELMQQLQAEFAPSNARLEEYLGRAIPMWRYPG